MTSPVVQLQARLLGMLWVLCAPSLAFPHPAPHPAPRPRPHASGWVPSGAWSSPAIVNPWPAAPVSSGWTDYSVGVDPWASQVVKKRPSYASLYPWAEKPTYRHVHVHSAPSYPSHHHGHAGYEGWTRIPVLDDHGASQWVAWVPEEFGEFVIVRKDKLKPKKKKKVEEEEEEEEEEPEPPKPKKKKTTVVEEVVEPPKKSTSKTSVTKEETETTPPDNDDAKVTKKTEKTEVIEKASSSDVPVVVPAPTPKA